MCTRHCSSEGEIEILLGNTCSPRTLDRMLAMFHESLLRATNGMDQHVKCQVLLTEPPLCSRKRRMSLQSALMGFLLSKLLPTPLSAQELIVVQTTAVATGTVNHRHLFFGVLEA